MPDESKSTQMKRAGEAADSESNRDVIDGARTCPSNNGWIEIELLGDEDAPICDEACLITDCDGTEHKGKTDVKGVIRLDGIPSGKCIVSFWHLDEGTWAGEAADSKSNRDVISGARTWPSNKGWIEIELLSDEDAPICDEACLITDCSGTEHKGKTDAKGVIKLDGIPRGECTVSFTKLDEELWGLEK